MLEDTELKAELLRSIGLHLFGMFLTILLLSDKVDLRLPGD